MKKLNLLIIMFLLMIIDVHAATNKLYFTEKDDRLYYDTDSFDETIFMHHDDMVPGKVYVDELLIENKTKTTYNLYLKVNNVEQDELADELIDNIEMEIYLDDELIYNGYARGLDYSNSGINLQDAILIGKYKINSKSKLIVYTKLSDEYANINNRAIGQIEWEFYASYEKQVIPVIPDTGDNIFQYVATLVISSLLFIALIMFIPYIRKKEND